MNMKQRVLSMAALAFLTAAFGASVFAQRTGFTKDEFVGRRAALMDRITDGMIVLFGETDTAPGTHFQQDNDFYYFTGNEDTSGICLMAPRARTAVLFLPQQSERERMVGGSNLLNDPQAKEKTGLTDILPLSYFDEYVARNMDRFGTTFHIRLSNRDSMDEARSETGIFNARRSRSPYNDQAPLDDFRIARLRERYPHFAFTDVTSLVDGMRVIKSAEEIEVLRRNGRISAEGVKQAMQATRPGRFEYEIEAAAMGVILAGGATSAAYAPIVGSGPNTCIWHYDKNSRRVEAGDLVLMDFGACLDRLAMDITRTWPASGTFTPDEKKVYRAVLEVQKACIEAYRPGATAKSVRDHVAAVMKQKGIDPMGLEGGLGHFVGLSTHDVGPHDAALKAGMVFAIEPALYFPDKNIGIRVEDTVLITETGCEVLTAGVPKEIEEIERLLAGK